MRALRALRWRVPDDFPIVPKAVVVVAPHTSNWDFIVGVLAMLGLGLQVSWLGKHTLFFSPLGALMRWLGGIPVRRGEGSGMVDQTVALLNDREQLLVALAPEGTRSAVSKWHAGFSRIAHGASVPIVPVALDWGRREVRLGAPVESGGDPQADEAALRSWYAGVTARRPEQSHP